MCPVDLFIDMTLTEVMKVSFFASDKSTTSSCVTDKEEFTSELIQIHKPHLWVFQDNSHQSGPWPGPAGVSGPPAGRGWAPSPHRWGSPEQWRWGCAARWRDKGGPLLHEWSGITCCRETRETRETMSDLWSLQCLITCDLKLQRYYKHRFIQQQRHIWRSAYSKLWSFFQTSEYTVTLLINADIK